MYRREFYFCDTIVTFEVGRLALYCFFTFIIFLTWAKPVTVSDDRVEINDDGEIIAVNGIPYAEYLKVRLYRMWNDICRLMLTETSQRRIWKIGV